MAEERKERREFCAKCDHTGFIVEFTDDPIYDTVSYPCPDCNPNPPQGVNWQK